jgi:hypothetical protein
MSDAINRRDEGRAGATIPERGGGVQSSDASLTKAKLQRDQVLDAVRAGATTSTEVAAVTGLYKKGII